MCPPPPEALRALLETPSLSSPFERGADSQVQGSGSIPSSRPERHSSSPAGVGQGHSLSSRPSALLATRSSSDPGPSPPKDEDAPAAPGSGMEDLAVVSLLPTRHFWIGNLSAHISRAVLTTVFDQCVGELVGWGGGHRLLGKSAGVCMRRGLA